MQDNNKDMNIFEKIQYYVLGVFYGQNKFFNIAFIIILLIFIFGSTFYKNEFAESDYHYGYINKSGEAIIKPQFSNAGDFHEGLAYACKFERCGYIDKTGKFVIKPIFTYTGDFHEGLAAVTIFKPFCGYIDKKGKFVIKPKFFWAGDFHEGLAQVSFWDGPIFEDDYTNGIKDDYDSGKNPIKSIANAANIKNGYIDKTGKIIMIFPPVATSDFHDGLAFIQINNRYGFIDKKGNMIISPRFDSLYASTGLPMPVKIGDKWGYVGKTGIVIEPQFDKAYDFSNGIASVKMENKWCYINKAGKIVLKTNFNGVGPLKEGLASFSIDGKQGYINKNGSMIIEPKFDNHTFPNYAGFYDGMAAVNINNKVGFINRSGSLVIRPDFNVVTQFSDGLVKVGIKK